MKHLWRILLYAGLDRAEYDALKDDALAETQNSLRAYSLFATVLFVVLAVFEMITKGAFSQNIGNYFAIAGVNGFVYLVSRYMVPTHRDLVLPLSYLTVIALYVFGFSLTMMHTDMPAVTLLAVLVLTPFLFTDRPIHIMLLNVATTAVFCVLSRMFKPVEVAIGDEWNGATLCAVSLAAAVLQRKLRFKALSQARRIRYMSETDLLTGAGNRNKFERRSGEYASRCQRSVTLAFIDVNGLHNLNDSKGHKAGDVMLQVVAQALLDCFGEADVYRIGGDEFVAFRLDAAEGEVERDLKRIKETLANQGYDISVGIETAERGCVDVDKLMPEAEKAMYRDKQLYYQQPGHERRRR